MLSGAVELADEIGIDDLTIRRLAGVLDVKPMMIYHHVANKDSIIDGMVDLVFSEIENPPVDLEWKQTIRRRCESARAVLGPARRRSLITTPCSGAFGAQECQSR